MNYLRNNINLLQDVEFQRNVLVNYSNILLDVGVETKALVNYSSILQMCKWKQKY